MSRIGFCHQDYAARILIEPVHYSRAQLTPDSAKLGAVMKNGVYQRTGIVPRRRMNHQTGGLVNYNDRIILENNIQGDLLRLYFGRLGRRNNEFNLFTDFCFMVFFDPA